MQKVNFCHVVSANLPADKTLHQMFEAQVTNTPDAVALIFEDLKLTYFELNARANQLAHYLKAIYVFQADDIVALLLERSVDMIVAILGVLKAGGAYVALDPAYSTDRISAILEDTQTRLLLTNIAVAPLLIIPAHTGEVLQAGIQPTTILAFNTPEFQAILAKQPSDNPNAVISSHNLAYVIYTSGTTGKPKGIMVEHQAVIGCDFMSRYNLGKNEVILQISNYIFDASVEQIFVALFHGYTLMLVRDKAWLEPAEFNLTLMRNKVTHIHTTPSFLDILDFSNLSSLRRVVSGGEVFTLKLYDKLRAVVADNVEIINKFAPSECAITSIMNRLCSKTNVGIGKPINNIGKFYILDEYNNPLPIGVVGELCVGGNGLARGYLHKPELTAQRFIANPFQTILEKQQGTNNRLYKTGDLVKYHYDGNIEYIGRNDFQVKIRGFRVELGEVESVISRYPGITQGIVIARDYQENDNQSSKEYPAISHHKYLIAYYVAPEQLNEEDIFDYLTSCLPAYMLPSIIAYLPKVSLTASGKLNRNDLPDVLRTNNVLAVIQPRTQHEFILRDIFGKVLNIQPEQISIDADFFRLGGNSLLAIKLVYKINTVLKSGLKVFDIFHKKTIKGLTDQKNGYLLDHDTYFTPNIQINQMPLMTFIFVPGFHDGFERNYLELIELLQRDATKRIILLKNNFCGNVQATAVYYSNVLSKLVNKEQAIVLYGYSSGGYIAYLMTEQLHNEYKTKLVLFDTYFKPNVISYSRKLINFLQGRPRIVIKDYREDYQNIKVVNVKILYFKARVARPILPEDLSFRRLRQLKSDMLFTWKKVLHNMNLIPFIGHRNSKDFLCFLETKNIL